MEKYEICTPMLRLIGEGRVILDVDEKTFYIHVNNDESIDFKYCFFCGNEIIKREEKI